MHHEPHDRTDLTLRDVPFEQLVVVDPDLADARRDYAKKTAAARRRTAEWEYDASIAGSLFTSALSFDDPADEGFAGIHDGVLALAIDPLFAPALLTVGSIEYQLGRPDAAMELFLRLTTLPEDEPDLVEIIDKACDFLVDEYDPENALLIYEAAVAARPGTAAYWAGMGYCLGKLCRLEEAVDANRRAVDIDPTSPTLRGDLGWSLAECGQLEEARSVLKHAIDLSDGDYDLARGNLELVEELIRQQETGQDAPTNTP